MKKKFAKDFIDYINKSVSNIHAVKEASNILDENGYERLDSQKNWKLKLGGKYYIKRTNSIIIAFNIGSKITDSTKFKIVSSHTDSPTFRIKPNPEVQNDFYLRLNTEVYGGPILNTWFDRPLSIAGRIVLKSKDIFAPKTININIKKPIITIPNLAIHQNTDVNNGVKIDRQKDVLPLITILNSNLEKDNYLLKLIAKEYKVKVEDILDFDLFLYNYEKGSFIGQNDEFVSAPRIDNLASVYAGFISLCEVTNKSDNINVFVGFDNEEVGSGTKQGADSNVLSNTLEKIYYSLNKNREDFLSSIYRSFMISADGSHAYHPAYLDKTDVTNKPYLNGGVTFKVSSNQRYASDAYSISVIKQITENKKIKTQYFVNNSNVVGGSTLGPISSSHLGVDTIDIGIPMLAMHSARELCGTDDLYEMKKIFVEFYKI